MQFKLYAIIGLGVLLFATTGYAYVERERRQAAQARATHAEAVAASKDRALEVLQEEVRAAQARARRFERIRQDVVSAPDSRVCAESPAVRAALRGLFPNDGAPGGAGGADRTAAPPRPRP
jgi:type VI protein secretion system component VasK